MSLDAFKTIYWWEWAHRLLARGVGIVFALPLAFFWLTGRLELLEEGDDLDVNVLNKGYASLTPIQYDMTAYSLLKDVQEIEL